MRPASSFKEDSGKGTISKHLITCKTWAIPRSGFQSFFNVFTHISPLLAIFGWKILVKKKPKKKDATSLETLSSKLNPHSGTGVEREDTAGEKGLWFYV